jgi:hypothetical protein
MVSAIQINAPYSVVAFEQDVDDSGRLDDLDGMVEGK